MPCIAHAPDVRKEETSSEKLARLRAAIKADPRPKMADSPEIQQHKLKVFEDWSDLREEASKIA
jgi:hypothetical protein